jgi:hypothetical protein
VTGQDVWEVFPGGQYLDELQAFAPDDDWDSSYKTWSEYISNGEWTRSITDTSNEAMPHELIVNAAIAYAEENDLWVTPVYNSYYDAYDGTPMGGYNYIWGGGGGYDYAHLADEYMTAAGAMRPLWIWHDSGNCPDDGDNLPIPYDACNHDEFLVFRVAGAISQAPK